MERFDDLVLLVVEPHALMRRLLRDLLRSLGAAAVLCAETIEDGFKLLGETHVDVVFTDWSPSTDALGLLALVRAPDSPNPFVPVIVVSAFCEVERVLRARDCGADEFLLKPFSPQKVAARLHSVLDHPRRFVDDGTFFGPDRRRHRPAWTEAERRRQTRYVERRFHQEQWDGADRRAPLASEGGNAHVQGQER